MRSGAHFLLTYICNYECDDCFFTRRGCSAQRRNDMVSRSESTAGAGHNGT